MNDGLRDVISAAVEGNSRKMLPDAARRVPQLRAVGSDGSAPEWTPTTELEPAARSNGIASGEGEQLGRVGLRIAFWLCGFHEVLLERRRKGEALTEREESLLTLSARDFTSIRSTVVKMAIARLHAVLNAPDLVIEPDAGAMEVFALETLRNLSRRAQELFQQGDADASLALFGDAGTLKEPLAIFQIVFTTALGLVEMYEQLIPKHSAMLARIAKALNSEVERI